METVRVLMVGDAVGIAGCAILQKHIPIIKEQYNVNLVIVNGENSAPDGKGITAKTMNFFKHIGVDIVTSGNHIWQKKEIYQYLQTNKDLLRPANFPGGCPGTGSTTITVNGITFGIMNLQARTFMQQHLGCPFRAADTILTYLKTRTNIILVDFHGETTSEKIGLGFYLDGQVSAVVGTHTHVPTADERILPKGTAFVTDLGMAGALNSMIGMKKDNIIHSILYQMPTKFEVEIEGPYFLTGVIIDIDSSTGKAVKIQRIRVEDESLKAN